MLSVVVYDRQRLQVDHSLTFTVQRYDAYAAGGPHTAQISATGTPEALGALRRWLGYYIVIHNEYNTPVWWGKLLDVQDLDGGASLADMYNAVKVVYSEVGGDGYATPAETDWVEHDYSISVYGRKEQRWTAGEANAETAEDIAETLLSRMALAPQTINVDTPQAATLRCVGIWSLLEWTYYSREAGREVYEGFTDAEQIVGWGVTSTDIGFADRGINRVLGEVLGPQDGDNVIVSGSGSNNGSHAVIGVTGEVTSYTATSISFAPSDDIHDSAEGLGFIEKGWFIRVTGSAGNSGYHLTDGNGRDQVTTATGVGGTIDAESAGPTITIEQGQKIELDGEVTIESPGATVTLSIAPKLTYSFTITSAEAWELSEVWIRCRREGAPGDNLKVSLYSSTGSAPNTLLDDATIAGTSLPTGLDWIKFEFDSSVTLLSGAAYFIVVERTGSASTGHYYVVGLDETAGHAGLLKIWNGSSWVARTVNASMPFQVWGHTTHIAQISHILASEGQFLAGVDVRAGAGVLRREWRAGDLTALTELESLLDIGSGGNIMLPTITADWRCIVDVAPGSSNVLYKWTRRKTLASIHSNELETGVLPVGQWCEVEGATGDGDALAPLSPFLIGYLEYSGGKVSDIQRYGSNSVWDIPTLLQG